MRYCKACGFPVPYGRFLQWTDDGTIIGKDSAGTRLVYLDVEEIQTLLKGVASWVGNSVDPIIYRAEKEVGRRFIKTLMPGLFAKLPRGKIARPEFGVKMMGPFIFNYMAGLGMGRAEVMNYRSGEFARVKLTESHSVPLIAGDGAGVFEFLERVTVEAGWQRVGTEEYILTLQKTSDEGPPEAPPDPAETAYLPGTAALDKCQKCGVPLAVTGHIYLNFERGLLRNKVTGAREVALPVKSFHAVFHELSREFGNELPGVMEVLEQKHARETSGVKHYADTLTGRGILGIFSDFNWRGVGNPTRAEQTGNGLEVIVENPFHAGIVAGRVAGVYEAWTGGLVRARWTEEAPNRLKVSLEQIA